MASIPEGGKVPNVRVSNWILIVDVPPIRAIKRARQNLGRKSPSVG